MVIFCKVLYVNLKKMFLFIYYKLSFFFLAVQTAKIN